MKNPLPPVVTETLLLGLWSASAVQVAGYTWAAVKSTWSELPPAGTGGGSNKSSGGGFDFGSWIWGSNNDPLSPDWFGHWVGKIIGGNP